MSHYVWAEPMALTVGHHGALCSPGVHHGLDTDGGHVVAR